MSSQSEDTKKSKYARNAKKTYEARLNIEEVGQDVDRFLNQKSKLDSAEEVQIVSSFVDKLDKTLVSKDATIVKDDTEVFVKITDVTTRAIVKAAHKSRNIEESHILQGLKKNYKDGDGLNWKSLGAFASRYFHGVSNNGFLCNSLEVEPKERKTKQKRQKISEDAKVVEPLKVNMSKEDPSAHRAQKHHTKLQTEIFEHIKKRKRVNYLKTVINPESFTQTVENIFTSSFLVKDAAAYMELDPNGVPFIADGSKNLDAQNAQNQVHQYPHQSILSFSMADWKNAIESYGIRESALQTRKDTIYNNTN